MLDNVSIPPENRSRFFKTQPGTYGAHDQFLGVTVPDVRKIAKTLDNLPFDLISEILQSPYNEERFLGLVLLIKAYEKSKDLIEKKNIFEFYKSHMHCVNNWNLVDASAHLILGRYAYDHKEMNVLNDLVASTCMWNRRIAIVSTWWPIKKGDLDYTWNLSVKLLSDQEDLMHKATGWMLREAGKKNEIQLQHFLDTYSTQMPRTMLRYAIEKLDKMKQSFYLMKKI